MNISKRLQLIRSFQTKFVLLIPFLVVPAAVHTRPDEMLRLEDTVAPPLYPPILPAPPLILLVMLPAEVGAPSLDVEAGRLRLGNGDGANSLILAAVDAAVRPPSNPAHSEHPSLSALFDSWGHV